MSKFFKRYFFILLVIVAYSAPFCAAETISCPPDNNSKVSSTKASASAFANLTSSKGSLKYELNEMLTSRINEAASYSKPASIVFSTVPNMFLQRYSDIKICQEMFTKTEKEPFRYFGKKFKTKDELVGWFYDFTQGNGDDGEDLYARCPGSCSPQYTSIIRTDASQLQLDVAVVCSHARDKSDNQYNLTSYISSSC